MLSEIIIRSIILVLCLVLHWVILIFILGKLTRFITRQVLDEIDEHKPRKGDTDNDDTFFNHD